MLAPNTRYCVQVRFYDDYGEASDWADTVEFATTSYVNDSNTNGIPDDQEVGYDVDLNEDGIADHDQPEVIKCVEPNDGTVVGVYNVSNSITAIAFDPGFLMARAKPFFAFHSNLYRLEA